MSVIRQTLGTKLLDGYTLEEARIYIDDLMLSHDKHRKIEYRNGMACIVENDFEEDDQ